MKLRSSISSSSSTSSPVQKHVQMVSKAASEQLLFKFPDVPNSGIGDDFVKDEGASISDFALVSCFQVGSCKQVHLGAHILHEQPARPSSARVESFDARTPLLPSPLPRTHMSTPLLRRAKPRFKRPAHIPSMADKVLQRFARGASKYKYRMRVQVAAKRYKLRSLVEP